MTPWGHAIEGLVAGSATLLSLWGEAAGVHLALLASSEVKHLFLDCPNRHYPSVGRIHPPAIRLERALRDLHGLQPIGMPDARPWLVHGPIPTDYQFLPVEGDNLHQIPVGPVHAGIIEPGHFRFTCDGETVVRVEERLGYVHRGTSRLMEGLDLAAAAKLAGRLSGDSTVAYALAFAQAVERASGTILPPRAAWLRALMAEMERLANHLGDVGAICNDASFGLMHAHCAILRERVLRSSAICFGHRLMMDCVVPGGISVNLEADGRELLVALVRVIRSGFGPLINLYDLTASLQDRTVGTGILRPELAKQFGAGGYVGRASGRDFDARRNPGYAPYDRLDFEVPVLLAGDVNARVWLRIKEIEQSLRMISQILAELPEGPVYVPAESVTGEGMALVEGFRGDIFVWLRLEAGGVALCHARDPSWFQWPLLEIASEGNIIADFPLCNKSFNCSYAGHDL